MPRSEPSRHAETSRHALLIGIQSYRHLPDLDGPKNDVVDFGLLLMDHFGFPDDGHHVKAHFEGEMTRDEIRAAFEDLYERVGEGDQVVVFYAGHGSWLEAEDGKVLQTLVPSDSGRDSAEGDDAPENRDILDLEIDAWIGRLNEKTPHVTLIFDSCHSGDVTRDALEVSRGVPPDRLERRPDAVAAMASRAEPEVQTRSLGRDSLGRGSLAGQILARRSALVLSACRAEETAKERVVGLTPHGAFSYELIRALKKLPAGATWRSAFERVASRVTSRYASQHPQIEGPWDSVIFGGVILGADGELPRPYLPVREVRYQDDGDLVLLGGGVAHGATVGSAWDLYPETATAPVELDDDKRPTRVVIEKVAAGASVARKVDVPDDSRRALWPREGFRAFPIGGAGADELRGLAGRNLLDMEPPLDSPLDDAVSMRVVRLRDDSDAVTLESEPGDGLPRAAWGEALDVEITHHGDVPVWTTLLAIESLAEGQTGVRVLWPDRRHEHYKPDGVRLEPGQTQRLVRDHQPGIAGLDRPGLRWLPPELPDAEGMVHLRLMVTTAPVDFSFLAWEAEGVATRDAGVGTEEGLASDVDDDLAWTFEQRTVLLGGSRLAEAAPERTQSELVAAVLRRKLRAAVIGINTYTNGITPLHTASGDAAAVAGALEEQGYEVDLLRDGEADRSSIVEVIQNLDALDDDTALLIYFAGHGVAVDDGTPTPRGYLLPADASRLDESTWVSMAEFQALLDRLRCRHLLLVLDCCFAGSFRWTATRDAGVAGPIFESQLHRYFHGKAWQLLTSASHNERALDFPPGSGNPRDASVAESSDSTAYHSPFAAALLDGLAGQADTEFAGEDADGIITVSELYQFLRHRLVIDSAQAWQTPGLSPLRPDSTGEFFFLPPGREPRPSENPPREASNPWLGLSSYTRRDHERFFGREREIGALCEKIRSEKLVVVTGASGSGKSSLVRAGLVPNLEVSDPPWSVAPSMRFRGPDPTAQFEEVVASLQLSNDRPGLVVLDQAEELFIRFGVVQQQQLLARIIDLVDETPLHVMITIRSDFEPQLRSSVVRAARFTRAFFPIPPPGADDLRRIVEGPAHLYGFHFGVVEPEAGAGYGAEPAPSVSLVDQIVGEVMSMPGALPQLSFALSEMYEQAWKRWNEDDPDRAFQREDFEEVGGVVGSIHFIASKIYESAAERKQELIRWMFLRMVTEAGGRLARRRVDERELRRADAEENELLQEALAEYQAAGLITSDEGFVEPGHDTLVTAWPDLLRWLAEAETLKPDLQQDLRAIWEAARAWADAEGEVTPKKRRRMLWHDDLRTETFADVAGLRGRLWRRLWHMGRPEQLETLRAERQALRFHLSDLELRFIDASASRCRWLRRLRWAWILLVGAVLWLGVEAFWPLAMRHFAPYLADYFDRFVELTNEIGWFVPPLIR